jgi:transposase
MEVLHTHCAGLDVHKDTVVACARGVVDGRVDQPVVTFGTTTTNLLALSDWLTAHGCTHVAMEATGVYWKPVWHVLEGAFALVLANAAHIKNVPGRKKIYCEDFTSYRAWSSDAARNQSWRMLWWSRMGRRSAPP